MPFSSSKWPLSSARLFWSTMYSLGHLYFTVCFVCKIFQTRSFNAYIKLFVSNIIFLLIEIIQLNNFFLEQFSPAGVPPTWETITLYGLTISRLMANVCILIIFEKCTILAEVDFTNKKTI